MAPKRETATFLKTLLFKFHVVAAGFALGELNRSTASFEIYETSNCSFNLFRSGNLDCKVCPIAGSFEVALQSRSCRNLGNAKHAFPDSR
jgi:hypothetical protein